MSFSCQTLYKLGRVGRVVACASVLGVFAAAAQASTDNPAPMEPGHLHYMQGMGHPSPEGMVEHVVKVTGASEAQKGQLLQLAQAASKEMAPLHEQLQKSHEAFMKLLTSKTLDIPAIEKLQQARVDIHAKLTTIHNQTMLKGAQVLTAEQRSKLVEEMMAHRHHHPKGKMKDKTKANRASE